MQTAGLKDPAAVVQVFTPVWPDMVMARTTMAYTISNTEARLAFGMIRTVAENAGMTKVYTTSATENPESLHDFRYQGVAGVNAVVKWLDKRAFPSRAATCIRFS